MAHKLEQIITQQQTLREEMTQRLKNYPSTLKSYAKRLAPALIVSSIGASFGQWATTKLGYDGKTATTAASYICGNIPYYITLLGFEYFKNKDKYSSILNKEFGEFTGTFLAADSGAGFSTFTPTFIASNILLTDNTSLSPPMRGFIAWNIANISYIGSIAFMHPFTRRASSFINKKVKSRYNKIRSKER